MRETTRPLAIQPGTPDKLGATVTDSGVNFALYSENATKVELCLFDQANDATETHRLTLPERTNGIWHGFVPGLKEGQMYGYRVYGPYDPDNGHRFNPNKLLIDPYAKQLAGDLRIEKETLYSERRDSSRCLNDLDSAPDIPKGVVLTPPAKKDPQDKPRIPLQDTIIYETHLKGATMTHPDVPDSLRGTTAGLASEPMIRHFKDLGVTTIELLPVHAYFNDSHLEDKGLRNFWGYSTASYFSPAPHLMANGKAADFRHMVDTLHDNGIEVMLDVVFNHTAEGNERGPTLSWRGIDNQNYYYLNKNPRHYEDHTGCGNTLRTDHPMVVRHIMDSLRYWTQEMGVDGFRFDLGTVLMREGPHGHGINPHAPILSAIRQDPVLKNVKLTGEPWDINTYQLGNGAPQISDWNDRFRDNVRSFWNGGRNTAAFVEAVAGSSPVFDPHKKPHGPAPQRSVNFIACHDGQTLEDNVSYEGKYNLDNGENNRDGHDHNISCNYGAEGPTDNITIRHTRLDVKKGMMASLLLSQGLPMIFGGDEFGNSQNGNNNAYCQDNGIGWLDWRGMSEAEGQEMYDWTKNLIALRKKYPALRAPHYLHGRNKDQHGVPDISWYNEHGAPPTHDQWHNSRSIGVVFNNAALPARDNPDNEQSRLYICFNASARAKDIVLPRLPGHNHNWDIVLETKPRQNAANRPRAYNQGETVRMPKRSVAVFEQRVSAHP